MGFGNGDRKHRSHHFLKLLLPLLLTVSLTIIAATGLRANPFYFEVAQTDGADDIGFATTHHQKAVIGRRHMVASANLLASKNGLAILRSGGSAADAAIAMQLILTLVEPQSSGLGGGAFAIHFDAKSGKIESLDGRPTYPPATTDDWFREDGRWLEIEDLHNAGLSVGIPGTVRLLEALHQRFGKLSWKRLFEPAIRMAEEGFSVSPRLYQSIRTDRYLNGAQTSVAYLFDAEGRPRRAGTRMRNPDLAQTLRRIADRGADAFYKGPIAEDIAAAVRSTPNHPAPMTTSDLATYQLMVRTPVCDRYRVWKVCGVGPPASSGTVLQTLKLLERFSLVNLKPNSAEAVHLITEASRLAYADRHHHMADPGFVPDLTKELLDPAYISRRSKLIDNKRSRGEAHPGKPWDKQTWHFAPSNDRDSPSTTHISVIDEEGNAVSMTSTIGGVFGSRIFVGGFFLNNQLKGGRGPVTEQGDPKINRPKPRKRHRSHQSPMMVFDKEGKLVLAIGSAGGNKIIAYVVQNLIAVLDWGLDIQQAINLPHHVARNGPILLEKGTPIISLHRPLTAQGHEVEIRDLSSGLQGIAVKNGVLYGGADPRREGVALGD